MTAVRNWVLIALVIGVGVLIACKNDSNKNTSKKTPGTNATKVATGTSDNTPSSSGNAPDVDELINRLGDTPVKATYTFSGTGATGTETFTLYYRKPDSRVDVTSGGSTSILISSGGSDYICDPASQSCQVSPVALGGTLPFLGFLTDPETLRGTVSSGLDHSSDTIAGQDADCYSASGGGASTEVCFNGNGILLRLHTGVSGADFTLEATEVSGTVSDSDLQPPYPVQ